MNDNCPNCETQLHSLEITEIYDGVCGWFCPTCNYYEIRDGQPFERNKDKILEFINQIKQETTNGN